MAKAGVVGHSSLSASHGDANGHGTAQETRRLNGGTVSVLFLLHYETHRVGATLHFSAPRVQRRGERSRGGVTPRRSVTPAGGEPYALRWKSLSTDPLKTLHLHLSADLFARTVQQAVNRDPGRVMVQERTGFQDPLLAHLGRTKTIERSPLLAVAYR